MTLIVIDVQGFQNSKRFIFKEIAYSHIDGDINVIMLAPPFDWNLLSIADKRTNRYLTYQYHGLHWYDGTTPYGDLSQYLELALNDSILLVKGLEKRQWLQQLLPRAKIIDLAEYNCPALKKLTKISSPCLNHIFTRVCAKNNVIALKKWCENQKLSEQLIIE